MNTSGEVADLMVKEGLQITKEVRAGYECGFVFERYNDIKEGDQVEAYKMVEIPR